MKYIWALLTLFSFNACALHEPSSLYEAIDRIEIKQVGKEHFFYDIGDKKYFGYAFPDDFATKNKYEQELVFRLFSEDQIFDIIDKRIKNKIKGKYLIYRVPLMFFLNNLIGEKQLSFAADIIFKDVINDGSLDGAAAEDYEMDYVWPTLENFKKANDLIEVEWAKREASVFCYDVDIHHFWRHPKIIYENIKKNKVYKFTEEVEKIEGCLDKIKNYEM